MSDARLIRGDEDEGATRTQIRVLELLVRKRRRVLALRARKYEQTHTLGNPKTTCTLNGTLNESMPHTCVWHSLLVRSPTL